MAEKMNPPRHRQLKSHSLLVAMTVSVALVVATHMYSRVTNSFVGSSHRISLRDPSSISFVGALASQAVAEAAPGTEVDGGASSPALSEITISSHSALAGVPLVRGSDGEKLNLPSLWGNGFFGLGSDKVVVAFLRHFG